jgi:preprotein translocase subunit SecE
MAEKSKAAVKGNKKKKSVFSRIISFFRACVGECKKISWPNWKQTTKNFGIVLVVIIICGLIIFGVDRGLYALLDLVMETANT